MILLDTNIISELVRQAPNKAVTTYLNTFPSSEVFTAAICEAEIRYGLERMPLGRRRDDLVFRIAAVFQSWFKDQVLSFDQQCAGRYGEIRSRRDRAGLPIGSEDAMIAATALAYDLTLATRNIKDFEGCGLQLVNPWDSP